LVVVLLALVYGIIDAFNAGGSGWPPVEMEGGEVLFARGVVDLVVGELRLEKLLGDQRGHGRGQDHDGDEFAVLGWSMRWLVSP
jgi:hypothetical protein